MTNEMLFQLFWGLFLTFIGVYAILHEQELIRFERKVIKYIKAFFKALYYTIKEKVVSK